MIAAICCASDVSDPAEHGVAVHPGHVGEDRAGEISREGGQCPVARGANHDAVPVEWVHLPEKYGNWRGVYNRLRMWAVDGTWEQVFTALMAQADADKELDWVVSVDSTIVRAHQHAAGARKKGPRRPSRTTTPSDGRAGTYNEDPSCCRDGRCRLLAFVLTGGQAGDAPTFMDVMAGLRVPRRRGQPRTRPDVVLADKAYSSRAIRDHLSKRGIRAVIPVPADQRGHRLRQGQPERETAGVRPPDLQAAQHRRTVHQPPEPVARHRHALREDHDHLPGRTPHRWHLPLVRLLT
ncbi:IS5 family transposase [Streptomyces avermitilis]